MTFTPADSLSVVGFCLILVFILKALLVGVYRASEKLHPPARKRTLQVALGVGIWLLLACGIVQSGFLQQQPFPRVLLFFGLSNFLGLALGLSPVGDWLARGTPLAYLIGFQAFRLPLEAVLHSWASQGTIPETMSWNGSNFDVISGIFAVVAALLVSRFRPIGWIFNTVGILLLLNVMRVAMMSSPFDWAWGVQPPLQLGFYLPYALIVPICVAGALMGHVVLTRALLKRR